MTMTTTPRADHYKSIPISPRRGSPPENCQCFVLTFASSPVHGLSGFEDFTVVVDFEPGTFLIDSPDLVNITSVS